MDSFFTSLMEEESLLIARESTSAFKVGMGIANGTFGEFLQGALPGRDNNFLVTLPISRFTSALFIPNEQDPEVQVTPRNKVKSLRLAKRILAHFDVLIGGQLVIESDLLEGKGLASSSADLVATARAVEQAIGIDVPAELVLEFLRDIEPTDGVMYPGYVSFYHRRVQLAAKLGNLPTLHIVAIDEGGVIDTVHYNQGHRGFSEGEKIEYAKLLNQLSIAFTQQNLDWLGRVATASATMNQNHLPKRFFEEVLAICRKIRGLGVVATHSGPCLGILLSTVHPDFPSQKQRAEQALKTLVPNVMHFTSIPFQGQ